MRNQSRAPLSFIHVSFCLTNDQGDLLRKLLASRPTGRDMGMLLLLCLGVAILVFTVASLLLPLWPQSHDELQPDSTTTTTIMGAGVIGLFTAYHLARAIHECPTRERHRVVVIDAAEKVFSATSATNTGILSYTGFQEDLRTLAQYSYRQWEALGREDAQFNEECRYRERANIALKLNSSEGRNLIPDWVCTESEYVSLSKDLRFA